MFIQIESLPERDARDELANTPPGNLVGGVAAAVMDKARDALKRD